MLNSVRARLTLWYSLSLAVVLFAFATTAYLFLARAVDNRTDNSLVEMLRAFEQTARVEELEIREGRELPPEGGWTMPPAEAGVAEAAQEYHFSDYQILVYDDQGKMAAASPGFVSRSGEDDQPLWEVPSIGGGIARTLGSLSPGTPLFTTLSDGQDKFRAVASTTLVGTRPYKLLVLRPLQEQEALLRGALRALLIAVPLALALASIGGYFLARKSLAPVVAMSQAAERIGTANLSKRLPVANEGDELGQLATTFNHLLERLDDSFDQQRRFMADASHELRTAVAVVLGESEVALSREEREVTDLRETLEIVQDEGRRLTRIVEDLFTLARADAAEVHPLELSEFYLDELVTECVRAMRSLASTKELQLNQLPVAEMPFHGDAELIRRMVMNLLENAIKYTPNGGSVDVSCEITSDKYLITVRDTGNGIPIESQSRIFERFYRADKARSRNVESNILSGSGAGLGLSIARLAAEAHGGQLELQSSNSTGTVFVASLPKPALS